MRAEIERRLSHPDEAALGWAVSGIWGRKDYFDAVIELLSAHLSVDGLMFNSVDTASGFAEVYGSTPEFSPDPETARVLAELPDHPMVLSYLGDPAPRSFLPRRMSDVASEHELHGTRAYVDLLRPWRAEYMLTILTARMSPWAARCWTFIRADRDFTDDELAWARRMQPLLVALDKSRSDLGSTQMSSGDGLQDLTGREVEILALVAQGLTAVAIGRLLRISPATVRKHLQNSYSKLGSHDRLLAVERARELGVLDRGQS